MEWDTNKGAPQTQARIASMSGDRLFEFLLFYYKEQGTFDRKAIRHVFEKNRFIVSITTDGEEWSEKLDPRGKLFIDEIQCVIQKIFDDVLHESSQAPILKVESRKGSNLLNWDLTPLIDYAVKNFTPQQIFISLGLLIGLGYGYFYFSKYVDYKSNILKEQNRHKEAMAQYKEREMTMENMRLSLQNHIDSETAYLKPLQYYVASLSDNDTIKIGAGKALRATDAREILRPHPWQSSSLKPR